jgi:hypothetical protein
VTLNAMLFRVLCIVVMHSLCLLLFCAVPCVSCAKQSASICQAPFSLLFICVQSAAAVAIVTSTYAHCSIATRTKASALGGNLELTVLLILGCP